MLASYSIYEHRDLPESLKKEYNEEYFESGNEVFVIEHDGKVLDYFNNSGFDICMDSWELTELLDTVYSLGLENAEFKDELLKNPWD